jgi:amino-acid N-acetyltransferase
MIRKAQIHEVPEIRRFLAEFARDGAILPRTLADLYGQLRDYYVYREDRSPLLGIAALHICWAGLGEIRSVAVDPAHQGRGIGSRLVATCLQEARTLGLTEVFLLTLAPEFFQRSDSRWSPGRTSCPLSGRTASIASSSPIAMKSPCYWIWGWGTAAINLTGAL